LANDDLLHAAFELGDAVGSRMDMGRRNASVAPTWLPSVAGKSCGGRALCNIAYHPAHTFTLPAALAYAALRVAPAPAPPRSFCRPLFPACACLPFSLYELAARVKSAATCALFGEKPLAFSVDLCY